MRGNTKATAKAALMGWLLVCTAMATASAFAPSAHPNRPETGTTTARCFRTVVVPCTDRNPTGRCHLSSVLCAVPGGNDGDNNNNGEGWNPSDLFESFRSFFWKKDADSSENKNAGNGGGSIRNKAIGSNPPTSRFFQPFDNDGGDLDEAVDDDDELPAGTSLLFKIPAKQMKPGGLRLFLMFYLMGMQNTPDRNTWRADQRLMSSNATPPKLEGFFDETNAEPEEKTYVLEMLYDVDRTGMLQIELLPSSNRRKAEIRIYRCGSRPSTSYLMQESIIVDGVLDELQNISGEKTAGDASSIPPRNDDGDEPEIAEEDRLLIPDPPNAIEAARESLAFG